MLQNAIILLNSHLVLIHCIFLPKGLFRRKSMVNLYTQEELNIFIEILSYKEGVVRIQIKMEK